jgi:hypothetical protein
MADIDNAERAEAMASERELPRPVPRAVPAQRQEQGGAAENPENPQGDGGDAAATPARRSLRSTLRARRFAPALAFGLVVLAFYLLCLAAADTQPWDADTSAVFLQGWDLVHGHVLLHGWWSSDVNFYSFEAPIYGLCGVVLGMGNAALHVAGALIYTIVFVVGCWAVKGGARGAKLWLRIAILAFCMTGMLYEGALRATVLLIPDHMGTAVFLLATFVLYDRHAGRRWAPWALAVLLSLGQLDDATVRYVAVPVIALVWLLDLPFVRRLRTPQTWLVVAAIASVAASMGLRAIERSMGAYYLDSPQTRIASPSAWPSHLNSTYESLFSLFGVPAFGSDFPGNNAHRILITVFGGLALLCGICAVITVLVRWTKSPVLDRLVVTGFLVYMAIYCLSSMVTPGGGSGYEVTGVIPMLAVLSARNLSGLRLPKRAPNPRRRLIGTVAWTAVAAVAAAGCLISGSELYQPRGQDPAETTALWLEAHGLKEGLAGYWDAAPMTVYTGDAVQVRAIYAQSGAFLPNAWGTKRQWYDASTIDANFVVTGGWRNQLTTTAAEGAFGKPAKTYQVGTYTVLVYDYNLLTRQVAPVLTGGA